LSRVQYILCAKAISLYVWASTYLARSFAFVENVIRVMDLEKEAPNVVTEPRFRDLVASGYRVEVVCKEDAFKKGPNWHGVWILRAVSDEGVEKLLVTARTRTSRNDIKIREIRTVTGVISFLQGIGFSHADIPLEEGKRTVQKLSGEEIAASRG
jgi:hypothetical protein